MKKKIVQFVFACLLMQAVFTGSASSQTTITISYAYDSAYMFCPVPITGVPSIVGTATGYPVHDSVNVHVYFGDGNDTSFWTPIGSASNYYYTSAPHRSEEERRVGKECRSRWSPY